MANPFGRTFRDYVDRLKKAWVILDVYYVQDQMKTQIRLQYDYRTPDGRQQLIYAARQDWDDNSLAVIDPRVVIDEVDKFVMGFAKAIPEEVTGKYPHIRLWADAHLSGTNGRLFGFPEKEIEGWIFGRYSSAVGDKYKYLQPLASVSISGTQVDPFGYNNSQSMPAPENLMPVKLPHINTEEAEELIMAATKKKIVKSQPPRIDPTKVKKPKCPTHDDPMEFDPVKYRWRCKAPGCKMVARPQRDEDDKSVQIGKGETSLRIVATQDEFAVLLVSDDNLALNITNLLPNIKVFLDSIGAIDLARTAEDQGQLTVADRTPRPIQFETRFGVIGVDDLIAKYDLNDF